VAAKLLVAEDEEAIDKRLVEGLGGVPARPDLRGGLGQAPRPFSRVLRSGHRLACLWDSVSFGFLNARVLGG
jgi:hypothetical protein